ncbi:MFS transporter [Roseococcus sp. SYP-B2431]|nr:MFS transporter [Roseococcus sp. SYP-B2431]TCH99840.1 MFS transporter [Roseococcus sp. SYP-B2431]
MRPFGALTRALSHRDARIFFTASLTSWTGLWMHRIAVMWLAWELTGSAFWVGVVAFADLAPAVIFSPIAGAMADRMDRVKLTMIAQVAVAAAALCTALLTGFGHMSIALLILFELGSGIAQSFAQPARQALMPGLVPAADLPAAVACNSLCFNVARFLGPAVAGPMVAAWGVVPAMLCNALAYSIASLTLVMIRVNPLHLRGHAPEGSLLSEMREGIRYVASHPGIGPVLAFAGVSAILLRGVQEVLPPFVERLFHQGAGGLAFLTAAIGVGALIGGLSVAARGRLQGTTRVTVVAVLIQSVVVMGFVATGSFAMAVVCGVLYGACASAHGISAQTLAQSASLTRMRGRTLALWGLITRACPALGAVVLGSTGEVFGMRAPTLIFAGLALLVAAWGVTRMRAWARHLENPT